MNTLVKKRRIIVEQAIVNENLEGLNVSKEARAIADNYTAGKASAKSAAAKIRARYRAL